MTNHEKYFGTPEKAAEMLVLIPMGIPWGVQVSHMPDPDGLADLCRFFDSRGEYLAWLKEECDE